MLFYSSPPEMAETKVNIAIKVVNVGDSSLGNCFLIVEDSCPLGFDLLSSVVHVLVSVSHYLQNSCFFPIAVVDPGGIFFIHGYSLFV